MPPHDRGGLEVALVVLRRRLKDRSRAQPSLQLETSAGSSRRVVPLV